MGAHKDRLGEAILMSTHNIGFHEDLTKCIFQLSSNTQLFRELKIIINIEYLYIRATNSGSLMPSLRGTLTL